MISDIVSGAQPVWLRAVMTREGNDVVTRCCIVTNGQFFPIEVRVNVPELIRQARALGIEGATKDTVGGFGSWLKKAVKTVTKSKVVKAVAGAVKKVANSPVAMIANPALVLSAHTTAKAATGKGLVKGKLGAAIDLGTQAVQAVAPVAAAPSALGFVAPKAAAALGVGLRAVNLAKTGSVIASAAKLAQNQVNLGKAAANAIAQKTVDPSKALPLVKSAAAIRAGIQKAAPSLAKQVVASSNVKKAFENIAQKARMGSADARIASNVIAKSAELLGTIQRLEQMNAGGVAGLLVTAQGRIVKAPKGKFLQRPTTTARPDILYRGKGAPTLKGLFSAVSGVGASPGWGGDTDPGNDIDGSMLPAREFTDQVLLDDWSAVSGASMRRKRSPPYKVEVTRLKRELHDCAEAYDELAANYAELTGREPNRYDDPRVIDTTATVGRLTP